MSAGGVDAASKQDNEDTNQVEYRNRFPVGDVVHFLVLSCDLSTSSVAGENDENNNKKNDY
jgi:hypothetical protein